MNDETEKMILKAVEKGVNGYLRDIKAHLDLHSIELKEIKTKVEALEPVSAFVSVAAGLRRFAVWLTPLIAFGIYKIFK